MIYENGTHLAEEAEAARRFARRFDCKVSKRRPRFSDEHPPYDYIVCWPDGSIDPLEIKCRHNAKHAYPSLMIDQKKLATLEALCKKHGRTPWLYIQWDDGDGLWMIHDVALLPSRLGGRCDRNDPEDIDRVVDIPLHFFQ